MPKGQLWNSALAATRFNEEQWWAKKETVTYHLGQGKKVREISGQRLRQVRVVGERLARPSNH